MSFRYYLTSNRLTNPPSYCARVDHGPTVTTHQLAARISNATSLTRSDVEAVLAALQQCLVDDMMNGRAVRLERVGTLFPSVSARMASKTEPLPEDARVQVRFRVDRSLLRRLRTEVEYERVPSPQPVPLIQEVRVPLGNPQSLRQGDLLRVIGEWLRFNPNKPDEGLFFVHPGTGAQVRAPSYYRVGDKVLELPVPQGLAPNTGYMLQVRARRPNSTQLRKGETGSPMVRTAASSGGGPVGP
ncbi:MAG: hypothetical protein N2109_13200 [Fimbriimonadales bacterium]|nr:hypothetical protein [Fimbriimonadales bacterium]